MRREGDKAGEHLPQGLVPSPLHGKGVITSCANTCHTGGSLSSKCVGRQPAHFGGERGPTHACEWERQAGPSSSPHILLLLPPTPASGHILCVRASQSAQAAVSHTGRAAHLACPTKCTAVNCKALPGPTYSVLWLRPTARASTSF